MLSNVMKNNADIQTVSGTKLDCSLPNAQFIVEGYDPLFRYDRNFNGGGILFFGREYITAKL